MYYSSSNKALLTAGTEFQTATICPQDNAKNKLNGKEINIRHIEVYFSDDEAGKTQHFLYSEGLCRRESAFLP